MKRTTEGYAPSYALLWNGRRSRPALMGWTLEVAQRMRRRGHCVTVILA